MELTKEIQDKIPAYQKRAVEGVFDGGRYYAFDLEKAKAAIKWNYEKCGYKMPMVLVAENILEQQLMFNILNTKAGEKWKNSILNGEDVSEDIYKNLSKVIDENRSDSTFMSTLKSYNNTYLYTLNVYSDCYYTWNKFIKEEFNLPLSPELDKDFEECFALQRASGIYSCIFSEELAVVCKYPKKIYQEPSGQFRLTNFEGPAVEWGSLTGINIDCYYINGVNVDKELFLKLQDGTYSMDDFTREENEEIKSACIAYMQEVKGDDYIINFFRENLKEIDTFVDKKEEKYMEGTTKGMNVGVYTLFKGTINDTNIAYVRCYCPSTDRMFFLGVDPRNTKAKDAIASLYRVPKKLKGHILEIHRQGERFSTNFTKEGWEIFNKMEKDDIEDLVSISGNEYFAKMKYEF